MPVLTDNGEDLITAALVSHAAGAAGLKYIAWGTGATAEAKTNTALATEGPEARVTGTPSAVTVGSTRDTYQVIGTITASAARAVTEVGLFNSGTTGAANSIVTRALFTVINLATGDQIEFTLQLQFT